MELITLEKYTKLINYINQMYLCKKTDVDDVINELNSTYKYHDFVLETLYQLENLCKASNINRMHIVNMFKCNKILRHVICEVLNISVAKYRFNKNCTDSYRDSCIFIDDLLNNKSTDKIFIGNTSKTPSEQIQLTIKDGLVIVFSDGHVLPDEEDSIAAKALKSTCKEHKPTHLICLGDTFDFAQISKHDKAGWVKQFTVNEELEAGVNLLYELRSVVGKSTKCIMTLSNHDQRFDKALAARVPQMERVFGMSLMDHIKDWEYGISIMINAGNINNKRPVLLKHQWHGSVHAAYQNALKSGVHMCTGHTHRQKCNSWTDYTGTRFGVEVGTLATLNADHFAYCEHSPQDWIAGFAVLTFKDYELLPPEFCTIIKDKAYFRGKAVLI